MARRKQAALAVPASRAEAVDLLGEYVAIERDILAARLTAEWAIDRIKAHRDEEIAALESRRRGSFEALKSWWEAGGAKAVAGRNRSAELAGAKIGTRLAPPAVRLARKVKEADVVAWLQSIRWSEARRFLRRPAAKLDKPALIKAAQDDAKIRETFARQGVAVEQTDEFFIDTRLDEEALRKEIGS